MKVLIVHNFYSVESGENIVVRDEIRLLRESGIDVCTYEKSNRTAANMTKVQILSHLIWSQSTYNELSAVIDENRPDIVHIHNTFPLMSPSIFYAAKRKGCAVIQTVHNYRMMCINAALFRKRNVCTKCVGKLVPYHGVIHRCYKGRILASLLLTVAATIHNALGTWRRQVDLFLAVSVFCENILKSAGIPDSKILVKPDPMPRIEVNNGQHRKDYFLYLGRLSPEKGPDFLVDTWQRYKIAVPLWVVGKGPLADTLMDLSAGYPMINIVGEVPRPEAIRILRNAKCLVVPSLCYEAGSVVVQEALGTGTPVICPDKGGPFSLSGNGHAATVYRLGDGQDLAKKIEMFLQDEDKVREKAENGIHIYNKMYEEKANIEVLKGIYNRMGTSNNL